MKTILFALLFLLSASVSFAGFPQVEDGEQCTENLCPLPSEPKIIEFHVICDTKVIGEAFVTIRNDVTGGHETHFFEMGSNYSFRAIRPMEPNELYKFEFSDGRPETLIKVEMMTEGCDLTLIVE